MKFLTSLTLQKRIFLFLSLFLALSLLLVWYLIRPMYEDSVVKERLTIIQQLQEYSTSSLDNRITSWINITRYLAWQAETHPNELDILLRQFMILNPEIVEIKISSPKLSDEMTSRNMDYRSLIVTSKEIHWLQSTIDTGTSIAWVGTSDPNIHLLALKKYFILQRMPFWVTTFVITRSLIDNLNRLPLGDEFLVTLQSDSSVWYANRASINPFRRTGISDAIAQMNTVILENSRWYLLTAGLKSAPLFLGIALPEHIVIAPVRTLLIYSSMFLSGIALIMIGLGWALSRQISKPVLALVRDVEKMSTLDFSHPIYQPALPDLAGMGETIEAMRKILERYQRMNVEKIILEEWKNRFFMQHSDDMIGITDNRARFVFMNGRLRTLMEHLDLLDTDVTWKDLLYHPNTDSLKETVRSEMSDDFYITQAQNELKIIVPGLEPLYIRLQNVSIAKSEEPYGSLLILHDLSTERQIDQMKSDMINVIVHELRNPLTSIKGFTSLMLEDPDISLEERKQFLNIIHESANSLNHLINRFLDIQRLESGRVNYPMVMVDLGHLLRTVVDAQKPMAIQRSLTFNVDIDPHLPQTIVSPELLREAFLNLISNAMKYGDKNRSIDIRLHGKDAVIDFSITDHGYGISAEDQQKLFTKFYRVTSNPKAHGQVGTGLGLAHVKSIAEYHQGSVMLESTPEIGCTFTVIIPVKTEE
jgi:signal transduction histidine kinase